MADQVWQAIEKELFAVLGMVTVEGEARIFSAVEVLPELLRASFR